MEAVPTRWCVVGESQWLTSGELDLLNLLYQPLWA